MSRINQYIHTNPNAMHTTFYKHFAVVTTFFAVCFSAQLSFAQDPGLNLENQQDIAFKQDTAMYWENKPEIFTVKGKSVTMRTNGEKYLWGDSHEFDFDFPHSHFYYRNIAGNFTAQTTVLLTDNWKSGNAGLLIKLSQSNWIKLYIGKETDGLRLNTVYASDAEHIDYATAPLRAEGNKIWLQVSCNKGTLRLKYSTNGRTYETVRILNMPASYKTAQVGLMADAPMSVGFDASFENLSIRNKAENQ